MAKFTNHARGPRGISLKDGTIKWLEPGQSIDLKQADIVEPLPDLGKASEAAVDTGAIDELKARVTALTKQVEDLTKERDELAHDKDALTKQVEDLTKPSK
ncbi:hypothetical protein [Novosphingobium pentaromativorans]|uniref:Uncharacterized protein n=1 Tax=Novosphingobium pentaromativorans US6-1 TaxID=1088721 RepID=G6E7J5_9SPHN|nr:hypothetical protein [Novosphingobium pentaromativorans]AIT81601.1 hypothetical protein JI59_18450 [Novosphingobium pentaromativorans US6-1]EHJ62818.1 hypothetical protein NSU_0330 [Novosphingobium pentaromativorans US6-1]